MQLLLLQLLRIKRIVRKSLDMSEHMCLNTTPYLIGKRLDLHKSKHQIDLAHITEITYLLYIILNAIDPYLRITRGRRTSRPRDIRRHTFFELSFMAHLTLLSSSSSLFTISVILSSST